MKTDKQNDKQNYKQIHKQHDNQRIIMKTFLSFIVFSALSIWAFPKHFDYSNGSLSDDFESWIDVQKEFSIKLMFDNIHPEGTLPGTVVAGTSKGDSGDAPPYFFHWTRDGALTFDVVVNLYIASSNGTSESIKYEKALWDYAALSKIHQAAKPCTPKIPDVCEANGGPGEPKYNVDGSVYLLGWGRNQNDGPALRALTFMRFANEYLARGGDLNRVKNELYDSTLPTTSVIKTDLEYVAHNWQHKNFDLWEEVNAIHFYTSMVQRRSMIDGAGFAKQMGDDGAAGFYLSIAEKLEETIDTHWSNELSYIVAMKDTERWFNRAGKDIATTLAVLHSYSSVDGYYGPSDDRVLSSALKLQQDFIAIYPINKRKYDDSGNPIGPAIGRYPEDIYDGQQSSGDGKTHQGQPWFLTTLAIAELYYQTVLDYNHQEAITITNLNIPFFKFIEVDEQYLTEGSILSSSDEGFKKIIDSLMVAGDNIVRRVRFHVAAGHRMDEQYNRYTGYQGSAENLTWSYASFITAINARDLAKKILSRF